MGSAFAAGVLFGFPKSTDYLVGRSLVDSWSQ